MKTKILWLYFKKYKNVLYVEIWYVTIDWQQVSDAYFYYIKNIGVDIKK
jgi:hypothetical protein